MTARTLICCQGVWPGTPAMGCRANLPMGHRGIAEALASAAEAGWTRVAGVDRCAPCSRRELDEELVEAYPGIVARAALMARRWRRELSPAELVERRAKLEEMAVQLNATLVRS